LLLIDLLLRIERPLPISLIVRLIALPLAIAEQKLDETAAHIGPIGRGDPHRRRSGRCGLIGVKGDGRGDEVGFVGDGLWESRAEPAGAGKQREIHFLHRRTHTVSSWVRRSGAFAREQLRAKPHRFGKRNRRFDSPRHHIGPVLSGSVYFQ
jgi:hypothetical protein